jgi:hypothetical protein
MPAAATAKPPRPAPSGWVVGALGLLLAGCASRSVDIAPAPSSPAEFLSWSCERMLDEQDRVQLRAADVAWTVDGKVGTNVLALGLGFTVFWPALIATRQTGPDATELARLKGRYEALTRASAERACPSAGPELPASRVAALPVAQGERLVYEDRLDPRSPPSAWVLRLQSLRRDELGFVLEQGRGRDGGPGGLGEWRVDPAGNVTESPPGMLRWPRLLRPELALGGVTAGEALVSGDPLVRARLRGQVVATGPQLIDGRRFDAALVELFGDVQRGDSYTRVDGALMFDRASGLLLRLDLKSADPLFSLQRRLVRIEPARP